MIFRAWLLLWIVWSFSSFAFAQNLFQKIPPSIQRGMEAYQNERFEEANKAFEEALAHMPSNAQLEFNRGTTFFKQKKYHEALQSLERARELDDGKLRGDVFYNMGNTYAAMGKDADAIASYRQALRVNPQDNMARHNLEFLLSRPPPPEAQNSPGEKDSPQDAPSEPDAHSASAPQHTQDKQDTSTSSRNEKRTQENKENGPLDSSDAKPNEASRQDALNEDALNEDSRRAELNEDSVQDERNEHSEQDELNKHSGQEEVHEETVEGSPEEEGPKQQERQLGREEADKILDAFGVDEKSYEPWRFQQKPPAEERPYEQDW